jgi:hypothetical protein
MQLEQVWVPLASPPKNPQKGTIPAVYRGKGNTRSPIDSLRIGCHFEQKTRNHLIANNLQKSSARTDPEMEWVRSFQKTLHTGDSPFRGATSAPHCTSFTTDNADPDRSLRG